ncbi:MAG TPA: MBL fold metallo-hydrolase [Gemmatimonadaceae bacterium]
MTAPFSFRFWGTRGSIPSPGASTVRYGGNTSCVEVRAPDGGLVILDAGTGIRALGEALSARASGEPITGDIFLSHAHWDHIQGLPFFAPFYERGNRFRIWSAAAVAGEIERVVRAQMSSRVFPVPFDNLEAAMEFRSLDRTHSGSAYIIDTLAVRHPGGALGFRLSGAGDSRPRLVYIPDNELGDAPGYADGPSDWRERLLAFTRGAGVLVHDATFTTAEYEHHRGWGHSHFEDALALALEAGVERLVLFHHSPERTDRDIDAHLSDCAAILLRSGATLDVTAAAEGMVLTA